MKNKPLIDNYERILGDAGYNWCVMANTFYVYMILPTNMTCWSDEHWKYSSVTASYLKGKQFQPYNGGYQ